MSANFEGKEFRDLVNPLLKRANQIERRAWKQFYRTILEWNDEIDRRREAAIKAEKEAAERNESTAKIESTR